MSSQIRAVELLGGWWRRWPWWAGYAAGGWALLCAGVLLAGSLARSAPFRFSYAIWAVPNSVWPVVGVVLLAGAAAALATVRAWGRRVASRAVSAAVWGMAVVSLAGSCIVLLQIIELVTTGTVQDRDGRPDWPGFIGRLTLAAGGALFVATALSWRARRAGGGACARCGRPHPPRTVAPEYPVAHAAPRRVRYIAYAGVAAWFPYFSTHLFHAIGGWYVYGDVSRGLTGDGSGPPGLEVFVLVAIAVAVFLLLGLVHPWGMVFPRWVPWLAGRRVPRFLPLTPAWLVAPTLMFYLVGGGIFILAGATGLSADHPVGELISVGFAVVSFGGYGWALGIAAVSYQLRTRSLCPPGPTHTPRPATA